MTQTLLTPSIITKEALRILHEKLTFIGSINRGYDDRFAKEGAKIGDTLSIRLPNQFKVNSGKTLQVQDVKEQKVDLKVDTQKHVAFKFDSSDLTLTIDAFADRYIKPAMSALAASMEADALNMAKDIYQISDQDATAITLLSALKGGEILNNSLAPLDDRHLLLMNSKVPAIIDNLKSLFQDTKEISKQYKEGLMGRTAGFDWHNSSLVIPKLTGSAAKTTGYAIDGANQTGSTLVIKTGTATFLKGDIVTLAGCYRVHPETKATTAVLQQFVVTADSGANATSLSISPAIVVTGANQNVSASPTNNGAIVKIAAGANEYIETNLAYHKDAFVFATADLIMPKSVDFSAREVLDGISMRIVRDYDINNDNLPCRIDVLYGYKTVRAELAARVHADG